MAFSNEAINLTVVFSAIICYFVYYYKKKYEYWQRRGVPFLGFSRDILFDTARRHRTYIIQDRYKELAPHPYGGIYQGAKPFLLVRDPEIVRTIFIKDFSHFIDRGVLLYEELDPLNASIFNLRGQRWKNTRNKLVPAFSSGKLKAMFPLMEGCIDVLARCLEERTKSSPEIEVRELLLRFAGDVIGTCAFGLKCNAVEDEQSEFRRMQTKMAPSKVKFFFRLVLRSIHPRLIPWLRWKGFNRELEDFVIGVTKESIKHREENQDKRNDFMQLLINLQQEEQKKLQQENSSETPLFVDHVVAAHVFGFLAAGFDATALQLGYCLYELALQPDLMERLYAEIQQVSNAHGGKLGYDALKQMPYMECVLSETLRKYTIASYLFRICTKSFKMPDSGILIQENTNLIIPHYALHHDPKYWPEPEKFNPDRFSEENKAKIIPGSYIPFGDGPRQCIAMRFAMTQMRAALAQIIKTYKVYPTARTQIPIIFGANGTFNAPRDGIHLRFERRK